LNSKSIKAKRNCEEFPSKEQIIHKLLVEQRKR